MSTSYLDYRAGLGNVGSYQASAKPFLSSSIQVSGNLNVVPISFPNVTRFITIKNTVSQIEASVGLRIGVSQNGVKGTNYLTLFNEESYSADWRVTEVFLRYHGDTVANVTVSASVIAGLTNIDAGELQHNWSGSKGVG